MRRQEHNYETLNMKRYFQILLLSAVVACNSKNNEEENTGTVTLEDIKLSDLSGREIDMGEFKDKTVFINFWATWCKPCLQEMPSIENAQAQLQDKDVIFLLASDESVAQIENFKAKRKFQFRYVQVQNFEALNIQALPTTYIFNPKGKLVFSDMGFRMWDSPENINLITQDANL
jgi:thiol-disulfide isomerase/thioredoxin